MTAGLLVVSFPGRGPVVGLVVRDGRITRAAPVARYCLGWPADRVRSYFVGRGCDVQAIPAEAAAPTEGVHS